LEIELMQQPHRIPGSWTRVCGIEINQGRFDAVWAAYDRTADVVYLYAEYSTPLNAMPIHAAAINSRGTWAESGVDKPGSWIPALIDIDAGGPQQRAGLLHSAQQLAALGVNIMNCPLDTEVALGAISDRLQTKRLNVYDTCRGLRAEYHTYRRGEDGKLPEGFGLIRAAGMVVVNGLSVAVSENKAVAAEEAEDDEPRPIRSSTTGY
jgi:hypothetical protein